MKNDCNVDTKKMYSKVEDFLKDDDFIKYVLDDAPESAFHWDKLLAHPINQGENSLIL
jgi:hypothetical protein